MATTGDVNMTEMENILPRNGIKSTVSPAKMKDVEASERLKPNETEKYDPFAERNVEHPTSDMDTLTHLLKASLGTGILSMPLAFKCAGLSLGVFCMILTSVVCTHCCYIIVKAAHVLYHRTRVTIMSFPDVGEMAFATCPVLAYRKYSKFVRIFIQVGLFSAYFGAISVYTVIIAANIQQVVNHYLGVNVIERVYILSLLVPLILLSWIPNLKALAPVSMVANGFMGLSLGITFYYLVQDLPSPQSVPQVGPLAELPMFFCISIFAIEAIGAIMPLENSMKQPKHFIGIFGVLNQGMAGVTVVYILIGFLGYLRFGEATESVITLNLPPEDMLAQSVKVLVALAVFCTYGLQYYVCLEIVWNGLKDRYTKNARLPEYVVRTLLTTAAVLLAFAVPDIRPFVGLIGAFCFSLLGLIVPIVIELVTFMDSRTGFCKWLLIKNTFIFIFGTLALLFGTYQSILDVIALYNPPPPLLCDTGLGADTLSKPEEVLETSLSSLFANITESPLTSLSSLSMTSTSAPNSTITISPPT